ncbi:MAG: class I SAM-dependent methyltransferase [Flavobacteriales bacterium]|nr:class I SAM-dependent methyltransferase [Flavobacteriales bacterium]
MTYFSVGDILDLFLKLYEKGPANLISRLNPDPRSRTKAAFDRGLVSSNWWIIPAVKERWNSKISGDPNICYEDHLLSTHFSGCKDLSLLSIGCGNGTHEIRLANSGVFSRVLGLDLAGGLIDRANERTRELGLTNCSFEVRDITKTPPKGTYDVILFHSSLHHFEPIRDFLLSRIAPILHQGGFLVVNEYAGPNRLQWRNEQIRACNELLRAIPKAYRKTAIPFYYKSRVRRPGIYRMKLSDPSEAPDSESILPVLRELFEEVEYKPYGGNLLHLLLKDIAHNFTKSDVETRRLLEELFRAEDAFLEQFGHSDFFYGVYRSSKR